MCTLTTFCENLFFAFLHYLKCERRDQSNVDTEQTTILSSRKVFFSLLQILFGRLSSFKFFQQILAYFSVRYTDDMTCWVIPVSFSRNYEVANDSEALHNYWLCWVYSDKSSNIALTSQISRPRPFEIVAAVRFIAFLLTKRTNFVGKFRTVDEN